MKKGVFKKPTQVKINARSSSITNAFINGIVPAPDPTDDEIQRALEVLGMTEDTVQCAYCGNPVTEWDHFHPLIVDRDATGYITEIHNLVPACGKCNQSKGNKDWKTWIYSNAKQSPKTKGVTDLDERVKRLEEYERQFTCARYDFKAIVGEELWNEHMDNREKILELMKKAQTTSDKIKQIIDQAVKNGKAEKYDKI